jgi:two-component system NarL family sensor kinase
MDTDTTGTSKATDTTDTTRTAHDADGSAIRGRRGAVRTRTRTLQDGALSRRWDQAAHALGRRFQPVPLLDRAMPPQGATRDPIAASRDLAQRRAGRILSVLRLAVVVGVLANQVYFPPREHPAVGVAIAAAYSVWSLALLVGAWRDALPSWGVWTVLLVDLPTLTALLAVSGSLSDPSWASPFTDDAFVLIPILAAFQLRPAVTAACGAASTLTYAVATTLGHARASPDPHYVTLHALFIALVSAAAVLLSWVQHSRTGMIADLARHRADLLAQAITAGDRERRELAEALHDGALQNVLVARQDIEEARTRTAAQREEALQRAAQALREATGQLRSSLSELHPAVLEHQGLGPALEQLARQTAARAHCRVDVDYQVPRTDDQADRLLYQCARELLGNAVKHARAGRISVRLTATDDEIRLEIADDGVGLPPEGIGDRVGQGHIGLASQQARIESAGGTLLVSRNRPTGTLAVATLPRRTP